MNKETREYSEKHEVRKGKNLKEISAVVKVDTKELDATIEKVNHLTELLKEAQQIIGSLGKKGDTCERI